MFKVENDVEISGRPAHLNANLNVISDVTCAQQQSNRCICVSLCVVLNKCSDV